MTPTMDAPAATGGEADVFTEIGDALSSGALNVDESPAPTQDAAATEALPPADTPPGEAPTPPPGPGTPPPDTPPGESAYQLTPDGKAYVVPKQDWGTFTGAKQYAEAVQQRFPTTNDAEVGFLEASDFRGMRTDFLHGTDADMDAVIKFWSNGGQDPSIPGYDANLAARFQERFVTMAGRMPEVLKSVSPQAYDQFAAKIIQDRLISSGMNPQQAQQTITDLNTQAQISSAYDKASREGNLDDPNDPLVLAAQRLDYSITGTYRTNDPALQKQWGVTGINRPVVQQPTEPKLSARETELQQREETMLTRDWTHFNTTMMDGPKWKQFHDEVDKVLAPAKDKYDPDTFADIREGVIRRTLEAIKKDGEWVRNHDNERRALENSYKLAWKSQQPADSLKQRIQVYQNDFMSRVRRQVPAIAQSRLNNVTATQVAATKQSPTRAQNGQFTKPAEQQPAPATRKPAPNGSYSIHEDPEFKAAFQPQ